MLSDTICAIGSALAPAGLGVVKVSGKKSISIVNNIFQSIHQEKQLKKMKSHTFNYGHIIVPETKEILDEVMVAIMKGPRSYTREDVIEIHCHGGIKVMEDVLHLVIKQGARLAEPGEFTKRAFLNGRIDLSQAEAVVDLINAKTRLSLKSSVNQLGGQLTQVLANIKNTLIDLMAHIEASIDYPEYEIELLTPEKVLNKTRNIIQSLEQLVKSYENGKLIKEGIQTVIIGKPNVGKSSLLNALLREDRAIVTNVPGTTRDILEEEMNIDGIPLVLMDTAGIHFTKDQVEKIGIQRAKEKLEKADLILFVLDQSELLDEEDRYIMDLIQQQKVICLFNKSDLKNQIEEKELDTYNQKYISLSISAKNRDGLDLLESKIKELFYLGDIDTNQVTYITNLRHKEALLSAIDSLKEVQKSIKDGMPEDCWAIDFRQAYDDIGLITGDKVSENMINEIFSRFCLGK